MQVLQFRKKYLVALWLCLVVLSLAPLQAATPEEVNRGLRDMLFKLKPAEIGLTRENFPHPVWGMVMETGFADGSFTLVSLADGTTSLYFSTGGGVIGGGEHEAIRQAAGHYLSGAQYFYDQAEKVDSYPTPDDGEVRFYFLGFDAISLYSANEKKLGVGTDKLSNLFYAAHGVIEELRKIPPPQ